MEEERRRHQLAANERTLREVNRRIKATTVSFIDSGFASRSTEADFFCACGRPDCHTLIRLSVEEYERTHAQPHRYIVAPGHENPAIERPIESHPTYMLVEKLPEYQA